MPEGAVADLTLEETTLLVKDAMMAACERDIYTGDVADLTIMTADGVRSEKFELKLD